MGRRAIWIFIIVLFCIVCRITVYVEKRQGLSTVWGFNVDGKEFSAQHFAEVKATGSVPLSVLLVYPYREAELVSAKSTHTSERGAHDTKLVLNGQEVIPKTDTLYLTLYKKGKLLLKFQGELRMMGVSNEDKYVKR